MKKALALFLALASLVSVFAMSVGAQEYIRDDTFVVGNADGDGAGTVNAMDLNLMKSYLLGNSAAITAIDTDCADLAVDGKINTNDVFYMKKIMLGTATKEELRDNVQTARLTIAGKDIFEYKILIPEGHDDSKNTYYAADKLQRYLYQTTGHYIDFGADDGTWTGPTIRFHQYSPTSEEGKEYGTEGYRYEVVDGDLNIYGTYRGNLYAAIEILEKYVGIRFFDHQYTFFYKQRYVDIPEGTDVFCYPSVKFRFTGQNVKQNGDDYYLPMRQNGTQIYSHCYERHGYLYGPQGVNAHSFVLFWQYGTGTLPEDDGTMTIDQRYEACLNSGEKKNEFSWQPCGTNGTDYETLLRGMFRFMDRIEAWGSPDYDFTTIAKEQVALGQKTMAFSLNDNANYCTCRYCKNKANGWTDRSQKPPVKYPPEGYSGVYLDMANKAVNALQDKYPGMRVHMILYDQTVPATVRPDKNIVLMCCGIACNNHRLDDPNCPGNGQLGNGSNVQVLERIKAWGDICKETGSELWFWHYAVTYHYYLVSLPCVFNIYWDYKTLFEECNVQGVYYEGGEAPYNYGTLKSYLSAKMTWEPDMSYDQYIAYMKEYLYMYYGDGFEKIYEFIEMENTAGDQCGTCFVSNFDRPGDMYSYAYIAENYEYMRQLLLDAYDMADREEYKKRIEIMLICFDFLGLSSVYEDMYTNGDAESRALYEERYTAFYNGLVDNGMEVFSSPGIAGKFKVPDECVFDVNPMTQIYDRGSRREGVYP